MCECKHTVDFYSTSMGILPNREFYQGYSKKVYNISNQPTSIPTPTPTQAIGPSH